MQVVVLKCRLHWLSFSPGWRTFDFGYLLLWGGAYPPAIWAHQGWRWISYGIMLFFSSGPLDHWMDLSVSRRR